jgi:hypothetical protein
VINHLHHLAHLKLKRNLRQKEKQSAVQSSTESDTDPESSAEKENEEKEDSAAADENDVVLNVVEGSDISDSQDDEITFVPPLRTVTRHGRMAGTWQRNFEVHKLTESSDEPSSSDEQSEPESSENESPEVESIADQESQSNIAPLGAHVTRSGRKAGTWKRFSLYD